MKVKAIDFVISHVTDTRAAVRFYRDVLGFDQAFIDDGVIKGNGSEDTWTEFDTRPVTLALVRWEEQAGRPGIALAVDDVVRGGGRNCAEKDVEIVMEPADSGSCRMAWIKDPMGQPALHPSSRRRFVRIDLTVARVDRKSPVASGRRISSATFRVRL